LEIHLNNFSQTVIVFGANGRLGLDFVKFIRSFREFNVIPYTKAQANIKSYSEISEIFNANKPRIVVNCAAFTNVDLAEELKNECFDVNVNGTKYIHDLSLKYNSYLIQISTASVFNSFNLETISHNASRNPINYYNKTKALAEELSEKYIENGLRVVNLRPYWIYGSQKNSFTNYVIESIFTNKKMYIVEDQYGQPTSTKVIAKLIKKSIDHNLVGFFPCTTAGITNRVKWAEQICEYIGKGRNLIKSVPSIKYQSLAPRPFNSCLAQSQWEQMRIEIPKWQDALTEFLENSHE
jgi:dTDP-4-dehydrorhamnose reductase